MCDFITVNMLCETCAYSWDGKVDIDIQIQDNYLDELVQERHNSIANALELCLSCTNPSIWVSARKT